MMSGTPSVRIRPSDAVYRSSLFAFANIRKLFQFASYFFPFVNPVFSVCRQRESSVCASPFGGREGESTILVNWVMCCVALTIGILLDLQVFLQNGCGCGILLLPSGIVIPSVYRLMVLPFPLFSSILVITFR